MATITNNYQQCELLNLAYNPGGRGPFIVRQEGSPPGSMTFQQDRFLLRKDGAWVFNLAVFALSEKDQEQFLFATTAEALSLLDKLSGDPVVEIDLPAGKSREQLKAAAQTTITGLWARIRDAKSTSSKV
jgi:hypothetical protein